MRRSARTYSLGSVVKLLSFFVRRSHVSIAERLTTFAWCCSVLVCLAACSTGAAEEREAAGTTTGQQLAATVSALEVTRHHVQQWESNAAARALVAQMMDDIVSSAELNVSWQSRFLSTAANDLDEQRDDFEQAAILKLSADGVELKQFWSRDGSRVVSGVLAHKSCVNCHDVAAGSVMAYVSLRFKRIARK